MIWRILIFIIVISSIENHIDALLEVHTICILFINFHYIFDLIINLIDLIYDQNTPQFDLELLEIYNNELDEFVWTKLKDLHQRKQNALRHLPRGLTDTARYGQMAAIFNKFLIVNSEMEVYYRKTKEQFMIKWKKNLTQASKMNEGQINAKDAQRLMADVKNLTSKFSKEYKKCLSNIFYKK